MKVTLGALEFEARPHELEPGNPSPQFFDPGGPLAALDRRLVDKSLRKILVYKCATGKETRYKLAAGDKVEIETDITFWVPNNDIVMPGADGKKSVAFGRAVMKASGLGDRAAFNTALQGEFGRYSVKALLDRFRQAFGRNTNYAVYVQISYQHYLLKMQGKRLNGVIAVSFPYEALFWGFSYKPCKSATGQERRPREFFTDTTPLLPDNIELLAEVARAHERRKPKLKETIERKWKTAEYAKKYAEDALKKKPAGTMAGWHEEMRKHAEHAEKRLKDFEAALEKKKRELQDG